MTRAEATRPIAPELLTPRLRLRGHREADLPDCVAMWADPEVTRYVGGRAFTEEEVWARILRYIGHWAVLGFGYWAIEERDSGRFIGEGGFGHARRSLEPSWGRTPEAGWALASWAHGKGFASEAVAAMLSWGDAHLATPRTVCMIEPANLASLRLAERQGYRSYARALYQGQPMVLLERG